LEDRRIIKTFDDLVSIYSPSFGERDLCDCLKAKLEALGASVWEDNAGDLIGGNCGNLCAFLPGELPGPPILLSAHMDTVEPAFGKKAVFHGDTITSEGSTILGADDASGIAIILEAIERIKESGLPRRSVELLFPVAEEKYGLGSAVADYSKLKAKEAFVFDLEGEIGEAANAAPSIIAFTVSIKGKASHAGFAPLEGIHAILAASRAVSRIPLGIVAPGLTCNIGTISGGKARNIIPEQCDITGEIRGFDHGAALEALEAAKAAFEEEAEAIGATAIFSHKIEITAYETLAESPATLRFRRACEAEGLPCRIHKTLGGSDNNNFFLHGIEGLVLACSMHNVHSARESASLAELEKCVQLTARILTEGTP
jgi:tripeptide aminopeptidase